MAAMACVFLTAGAFADPPVATGPEDIPLLERLPPTTRPARPASPKPSVAPRPPTQVVEPPRPALPPGKPPPNDPPTFTLAVDPARPISGVGGRITETGAEAMAIVTLVANDSNDDFLTATLKLEESGQKTSGSGVGVILRMALPPSLPPGDYHVTGTVQDGFNPPVLRTITITVGSVDEQLEPGSSMPGGTLGMLEAPVMPPEDPTQAALAMRLPPAHISASLRDGDLGGGRPVPTMGPAHGDSPGRLGLSSTADGVTFVATERDGASNAVIAWQLGREREQFRRAGTVSLWIKVDRARFHAGQLWSENYGWNGFHNGQGTLASFIQATGAPGAERLRVTHTFMHGTWFGMGPDPGPLNLLSFDRWHHLGFTWGGKAFDHEMWLDGRRIAGFRLPAGANRTWGLPRMSGAVIALGKAHERGLSAHGSPAGVTYRNVQIWLRHVPGAGTTSQVSERTHP